MNQEDLKTHLEARLKDNSKSLIFAWLADLYLAENRIQEAIQLCTEGIKNHPSYVTGYFILAKAYLANQESENAETALKNVLSHDREYLSAHLLLGDLMKKMGWENKAAAHYREILAIDPAEDIAKERLATLSEATTWDFSGIEEEQPSAAAEEVSLEEPEEENWVDAIREVFPEEISAGMSARSSRKPADSDGTRNETLQDLDTFLDEKFSQPVSETPEFFAITDTKKTDAEKTTPGLGPDEEKIAAEFLGENIPSVSLQSIEDASQKSDGGSAPPSTDALEGEGFRPLKNRDDRDILDSKEMITEKDFEDALGFLEEIEPTVKPSSGQDEIRPSGTGIPEAAPLDNLMEDIQDIGVSLEVEESLPKEEPLRPSPASDVEESRESGIADAFSGANLDIPDSAALESAADEQGKEEGLDSSSMENLVIEESDPSPLSTEDADFGFSKLGELIPEQPPLRIEDNHEEMAPPKIPSPQTPAAEEPEAPPPPSVSPETPETEPGQPVPRRIITPTLGEIYAAQGQYDKAIAVYEELLEQNPEMARYREKIDELRKKMNAAGL
jgi:tetratricopeptide (TPR) repeat protein